MQVKPPPSHKRKSAEMDPDETLNVLAKVRRPSISGRRPSISGRRPSISGRRPSLTNDVTMSEQNGSSSNETVQQTEQLQQLEEDEEEEELAIGNYVIGPAIAINEKNRVHFATNRYINISLNNK
jgi:hypothetical protein